MCQPSNAPANAVEEQFGQSQHVSNASIINQSSCDVIQERQQLVSAGATIVKQDKDLPEDQA